MLTLFAGGIGHPFDLGAQIGQPFGAMRGDGGIAIGRDAGKGDQIGQQGLGAGKSVHRPNP
jgi:hypothetical protein